MNRHSSTLQRNINDNRMMTCWGMMFVVCLSIGCGASPQAEFQYRESTLKLIPSVQKEFKKTLDEGFGTPNRLVAWEKFPIEYGGVRGSVSAAPEEGKGSARSVAVTLDGDVSSIPAGSPLIWLTGARANEKSAEDKVASFDAKSGQLKWSNSAEPVPAPGDKFAIGFGESLRKGRVVYMKNCMHCHGVTGDGAGPTAEYLNPRPRDYRLGLFKFTSTLAAEKASRDDLNRIVKYGIPGTYMPSFLLLGEAETRAVVEYVRWLAVRGEFEKRLNDDLADYSQDVIDDTVKKAQAAYDAAKKAGEKPERPVSPTQARKDAAEAFEKLLVVEKGDSGAPAGPSEFETMIEDTASFLAMAWTNADDSANVIVPTAPRVADDSASRERGRRLYMSDKTKCYTCHGPLGRGDGVATEDYWKKPGSEEMYPRRGLHDSWGNPLPPRNLTLGQYRGGRRPIDVFRRIYAGIKGTPMPGFGKTALKDEEIWDVVNYVMSLQYQSATQSSEGSKGHVEVTEASQR